jgi:NPCBM/NEW2 domain
MRIGGIWHKCDDGVIRRPRRTMTGMKRIHTILLFALSATTLVLFAAEEPPPVFVVSLADGMSLRGSLRELKPDWSLRVNDKALTAHEVVGLRRGDGKRPPFPVDKHLILANGDRIPVDPIEAPRLVGEKLLFRHPDLNDGKEVSVPLAAVAVLWRTLPDNAEHADLSRRQLLNTSHSRDRVLLRNGDAIDGLFNALDAKRVEVDVDKKALEVVLDKVAAIALNTDGVNKLKQNGVYGHVVLTGDARSNGTRLSLASATCTDGSTLQGTTTFGASLRVPLQRVAALDWMQGAAVYLSDLKPAKFEQTPYLGDGLKWPLAVDAAVSGRDLRLDGSVYDKGLGMHSRSRATYALDGAYRRFEAVVGLDDETGREGSAHLRVFGDGKALDLGKDGLLTAKTGPLIVNVSIAGVKELTLEVDFGRRGDVQGHVDWCNARIIK